MNVSTALNHWTRLSNAMRETYFMARLSGCTHAWVLSQLTERVWEDPGLKRCPGWVRDRLSFLSGELLAQLHMVTLHYREYERALARARAGEPVEPARYLTWVHRLDGREVTLDEVFKARDQGDATALDRMQSAHVWNHKRDVAFSPWTDKDHKEVTA